VRGGVAVVDTSTDLVTPDDNPTNEQGATTAEDEEEDEDGFSLIVFLAPSLRRLLDSLGL
jgi:hypothetical protein